MITFFTLALDACPWICHHYQVFRSLSVQWRWIVVEGVADNVNCTSWCAKIPPRLSNDGTTEYIDALAAQDARVTHIKQPLWPGKVSMCNAALGLIHQPCLLWQLDSDELWTGRQISEVYRLFREFKDTNVAYFFCRYFVGPDLYVKNRECYGNNSGYEWKRVWRFAPGMRFLKHEPPVLSVEGRSFIHRVTETCGCVFDHFAYACRKQVEFKERYYAGHSNPNGHKYVNASTGWDRLQQVKEFPVRLIDYFPWSDDRALVARI